jgi:hypothetical protein
MKSGLLAEGWSDDGWRSLRRTSGHYVRGHDKEFDFVGVYHAVVHVTMWKKVTCEGCRRVKKRGGVELDDLIGSSRR